MHTLIFLMGKEVCFYYNCKLKKFPQGRTSIHNIVVSAKIGFMLWNLKKWAHFQKHISFLMQQCAILWFQLFDILFFLHKT
jgi:hypothetical protein